jgi:hypothetical protein
MLECDDVWFCWGGTNISEELAASIFRARENEFLFKAKRKWDRYIKRVWERNLCSAQYKKPRNFTEHWSG